MKKVFELLWREPLAVLAILVTLIPFSYNLIQEEFFSEAEVDIECRAPRDDQFQLENGFLYYETRCLIINRTEQAVSLVSLVPVMQSGSYPYPLVGPSSLYEVINEISAPRLHAKFTVIEQQVPLNIRALESYAVDVFFATSAGRMRNWQDRNGCSENFEIERLSGSVICLRGEPGSHPAEIDRQLTAKGRIYQGWSYGFFDVDGFGLLLSLGDGRRLLVEADLTEVSGYVCNAEIRQLNCEGRYGFELPRTIALGKEHEFPRSNWEIFVQAFPYLLLFSLTLVLAVNLLVRVVSWTFLTFRKKWLSKKPTLSESISKAQPDVVSERVKDNNGSTSDSMQSSDGAAQ